MLDVWRAEMVSTPLPVPAHFSHAQRSFSQKKRRLPFSPAAQSSSPSSTSLSPPLPGPLSWSLPPRPPSKGCQPVSRIFLRRRDAPFTPLSRQLLDTPPPTTLYQPERPSSYFHQCFVNLGLIGRGSFGEVYKVRSLLDGGLYAVKRSAQRFRSEAERAQSIREARNHELLGPHPHILRFVAAWEEGGRLYIQTELCTTSLLLHAEAQPHNTGEACAWDYLCDLLSALSHLHSQGFTHLDLKPANVFLTRCGRLKLGDFGLMLELGADPVGNGGGAQSEKDDAQEGDPRYMAPELLKGEYGAIADVFSLGVSILELACNIEVPKGGDGWQQLRQGHLPSEFTNALSPELQRVLRLMLATEPRERATVQQLLTLPSVRKHIWRRRLSLRVREAWSSVITTGQCLLSAGWSFLCSLSAPFLPQRAPPAPRTPPRECWELDADVSTAFSDSVSTTDEPAFSTEVLGLEHSPTYSHSRITSRLSSTSTPLPSSDLPQTPIHSLHKDSLFNAGSRRTPTATPGLSPICLKPTSHRRSGPPADLRPLSDSPASIRDGSQLGSRSAFEPKNLISLFDEALENQA